MPMEPNDELQHKKGSMVLTLGGSGPKHVESL